MLHCWEIRIPSHYSYGQAERLGPKSQQRFGTRRPLRRSCALDLNVFPDQVKLALTFFPAISAMKAVK